MSTQGGEANSSGEFLKRLIENEFRSRGIPVVDYRDNGGNGDMFAPRLLIRDVPYTSIYKKKTSSAFVYRQFYDIADIRIACRWQEESGSVDEKLPYMFLNARDAMPEREIWMVLDGGGAKPEAIEWLRQQTEQVTSKTIKLMDVVELRHQIKVLFAKAPVPPKKKTA